MAEAVPFRLHHRRPFFDQFTGFGVLEDWPWCLGVRFWCIWSHSRPRSLCFFHRAHLYTAGRHRGAVQMYENTVTADYPLFIEIKLSDISVAAYTFLHTDAKFLASLFEYVHENCYIVEFSCHAQFFYYIINITNGRGFQGRLFLLCL